MVLPIPGADLTRIGGSAAAQQFLAELLSQAGAGGPGLPAPQALRRLILETAAAGAAASRSAAPDAGAAALQSPNAAGLSAAASMAVSTAAARGRDGRPADAAAATAPATGGSREAAAASTLQEALQTFIVFLEGTISSGGLAARAESLLRSIGLEGGPSLVYDWLNGFVLQATATQAARLSGLADLHSLEADAEAIALPFQVEPLAAASGAAAGEASATALTVSALSSYTDATAASGEILPWGVRAVWQGEDISLRGNTASNSYAFVIDSGVQSTTGDLSLASSWHRSWVSGETAFTDGSGHGTHVAGTIGALANGRGVVGVAPGAQIVSLKVFNSSGGGASFTSIIDAVNHAVGVIHTNRLDKNKVVINMSLGGGFSASLDTALRNAAGQGIRFAVAAGNEGQDADNVSPAAAGDHANVYTVSAVNSNYAMASWSNWDRLSASDTVDDVDLAAPGVSVLSHYVNGQLAYLSGTSMAAPHVAGLLLMGGVQAGDLVSNSSDAGRADPFALAVPAGTAQPDPSRYIWGTNLSDTISGGSGADRLSGVRASGSKASDLGAGQRDTITGGAGMDVFLLGDSRGVFYDDRISNNLGSNDYALIKDFRAGEDKLQLRQGNYLFTAAAGSLSLFWDRTGIGVLNASGSNQDELIAILEGVSGIGSADILWA